MDAITAMSQKRQMSERVVKLKREFHESPAHLSIERLRFLMDIYREHAAEPVPIVRARLLERILTKGTIFIDDNPIVGTSVEYRRGAAPMPEFMCRLQIEGTHSGTHTNELPIEDRDIPFIKGVAEYWRGKCIEDRVDTLFAQMHPDAPTCEQLNQCGMLILPSVPVIQTVVNWKKMLAIGVNGVIQEAEEHLRNLQVEDSEYRDKRDFLQAAIISLKAAITFAHRYSSLARELSIKEENLQRKTELEKIADACHWVPANPPRSFHEAIQSFWFVFVTNWIEARSGVGIGRLTDYLYPFYAEDKRRGRITEEEAIELLQLLMLKISECGMAQFAGTFIYYGWQNNGPQVSLGGVNARGDDATNELDFLLLEAQKHLKSAEPSLSVTYHDRMSQEFLVKCVEVIRTGIGQPAFYNNDILVQRALFNYPGISLAQARNITPMGCIQTAPCGSTFYGELGFLNSAKMLELALNNGKDLLKGIQLGPRTGDAKKFDSYQELHEAVRKQFQYFLPLCLERQRITFDYFAKLTPMTFQSALVDGCLENGKDIYNGGAKYNQTGATFVATIDLANSLAAIKKLVFDDKRITMDKLVDTLQADFEGEEGVAIQKMCLNAPKYGNDDPYVDNIVKEWYEILYEEHRKAWKPYPTQDSAMVPYAFSNSMHVGMGQRTAALPSGRKARMTLTDASVSAMPGTDTKGPTALAKSAASAIDCLKYGSNHLNMKFLPSALEGGGARVLLALIKTYMDLGGHQVQFNCVSGETLKDAQRHPEKHRDLVVRVAGYSAYFVHLPKGIQDEIIARTELGFS